MSNELQQVLLAKISEEGRTNFFHIEITKVQSANKVHFPTLTMIKSITLNLHILAQHLSDLQNECCSCPTPYRHIRPKLIPMVTL